MTDEIPESMEQRVEAVRRSAIGLTDWQLDESLACAVARRDVAVAHGKATAAEAWNDVAIALDDVRRTRTEVRREIEELTGPPPPIVRPLTAEELAEIHFDDEVGEPPC